MPTPSDPLPGDAGALHLSCPPDFHRPVRQFPRAAAVLDCDGVLVTTEEAWTRAYHQMANSRRIPLTPAVRTTLSGLDLAQVGRRLTALLHTNEPADYLAAQALELFQEHVQTCLAPIPGAVELLVGLTATRPVAIVSNAPRVTVEDHLRRCLPGPLLERVTAIITADATIPPKPDPSLYLRACTVLQVDPSDAVAVEDSPVGARSALSAGLHLVAAPNPETVWNDPACLTVATLRSVKLWRALGLYEEGDELQITEGALS